MSFLLKLTPLLLLLSFTAAFRSDRVLLRDVDTLVFNYGDHTSFRRTFSVPSLKCVGGSAKRMKNLHPTSVMCKNVGWDGADVVWECTSDLSSDVRLGKTEVYCEGYDYPEDPYVTRGSCGLEYTLESIGQGRPYFSHASQHDTVSPSKILGFVIVLSVVLVLLCVICPKAPSSPNVHQRPLYPNVPEYHVPPMNERNDYGYSHGAPPPSAPPASGARDSGPGFWSGMGLGYLFGRRRRTYVPSRTRSSWNFGGTPSSSFSSSPRPSFGSSSRSSFGSSSRSSTSFASTKRR
ncbi:hypothetical protein GEMRC1_007957 [Eukaryota sp. GEM-RC1]